MKCIALVVAIAACGSEHDRPTIVMHDAKLPVDATISPCPPCPQGDECGGCSLLTQAGCSSGQKCTWVLVTDPVGTAPGIGSISCIPDGVVAIGGACAIRPAATCGYDNCESGGMCVDGFCKMICDNNGGTPACGADQVCVTIDGLFANEGATTTPAGVCEPSCNPLDDNDFDGSGSAHTKLGTACGSDPVEGCYGIPSPTHTSFQCARPAAGTELLTHRSIVPGPQFFISDCMSGYTHAFTLDADGSMNVECYAFCKPADAYLGNPNAQQPNGVSPHGCNTTDALGAFGAAPNGSPDSNGEHCMYSWLFEQDTTGVVHHSSTSDTVGICWDHSRSKYDSNGDGTADTVVPPCAALPLQSTTGLSAIDLGCISTAVGGLFVGGRRPHIAGMPEFRPR